MFRKILKHNALVSYEQWYKQDVSPNLDNETKLKLAEKISELSLKEPIFLPDMYYPLDRFPELKPYSHANKFTGMQLYVVFREIMREQGYSGSSASEVALTENEL